MSLPCTTIAQGTAPVPAPVAETSPATFAQHRIWSYEQARPGRATYNLPLALSFEGPLDTPVLEHALNDVVARHGILRTHFESDGATIEQVVSPTLRLPLPVIDLRLLPPAGREAQAFLLAREEASRPFDLRRLPLLRAQLFVLDETHRILVLTAHQIIFDGRSRVILLRELAASYDARRNGKSSRLPELRSQFSDHARFQRERLPALENDLAWWTGRLANLPEPLPLPIDRPSAAVPTGRGSVEIAALPPALPLEALAHDENVTVTVVLLAAFTALLHRYTAQSDIVVATSSAGRHRPESENLIGLFRNLMLLRTEVSGDPTFRTLLGRTRGVFSDALSHSEAPFEKIAAKLGAENAAARPPGCQIFFAHDRRPLDTINWPGLRVAQLELDSGAAKHDLALHIVESPIGFTARAEYDSDLFSAATIQRLLAHFGVLLRAAVTSPNRPISALPLITEAERRVLIAASNQCAAPFPRDATVHSLIAARARTCAATSAVVFGEKRLSYRELDERANQLARHLQASGVAPGVVVGLLLERGCDLAVATLAVMKAGGAFLVLEGVPKPERAALIAADGRLAMTLCHASLRGDVPPGAGTVITLEDIAKGVARLDAAAPPAPAAPDDLACVLLTRGRGQPARCVELSHRALVNALHSLARNPGASTNDVILSVAEASSSPALLDLLLGLTAGARLVHAPAGAVDDPSKLDILLVQAAATILHVTPSTCDRLLAAGWSGRKTVRIFAGGERLTRSLADRLLPRCRELWHLYGTTETAVYTAANRVTPGTPIVIGRSIGNAQIHLLDRHLQPVPIGLVGAIHLGGESLALGYRGQTALGAQAFVPDPFRREPGARLFATGDLGRRLPGGEIEYVGRVGGEAVSSEPMPVPASGATVSPLRATRRPGRSSSKQSTSL